MIESPPSDVSETQPVPAERTGPLPSSFDSLNTRLPTLDILRGMAVLGILLVSIKSFGLTQAQVGQLIQGPHGGNYWLLLLTHVLFEHKVRALFSLLFGAGIVLFLAKSKKPDGLGVPELLIRRHLWLMVFGLVNAFILLSPSDILFQYGVMGILLFPFHRLPARTLLIAAVVAGLLFSGKNYWNFSEQQGKYRKYEKVVALEKKNKKVKLTDEQKEDKTAWEGILKWQTYDKKKDQADVIAMRSDYGTVWNFLLQRLQGQQAFQLYRLGIWDIASMMLLGMALLRWGFFSNRLTISQYAGIAVGGLVIGQTLAWLSLPSYELRMADYSKFFSSGMWPWTDLLQPFERAFSVLGWAGLVLLLYRTGIGSWLWRAVEAVGQLALTNYFMQTVFCTLFFYGYGMGYFGSLTVYQLYIVVVEIWLIQLIFSVVWLRSFQLGPVEWLWRSLIHGRQQPFRRTEPVHLAIKNDLQPSL